ncbi:MAG: acyl-CoA thioester hydrolase [Campylobacterota bacterium]|nr:acyl-CoA thioester hydrolase [Campylobacterota bacterium]MDQ1268399.1 acyl-CoA thioester hydrolase [Campylobacterota bacterium]
MKIRVYYEDTDAGGIVYHSNYLNFCERARSEMFFQKGLSPVLPNGHFVAKKLEADYISSAKLGDELEVLTELVEIRAASFVLLQSVFKGSAAPSGRKIFELKITLAYVTFEGRPQKITRDVKELIESLFRS